MLRRLLCILLTLCLLIGYAAAEDSASAAPTQDPPEGALANGMVDGAGESAVQGLQQRLIDLGLLTGEADGHFGDATAVAVELFQQMYGLDATGYADEETLSALSAAQDGVLEVQEDLIAVGVLNGAADGVLGESTEKAISTFQQMFGLEATGVADPETRELLSTSSNVIFGVQTKLIELAYLTGVADGVLGPATETAISEFQQMHGLEATGVADPETRELLQNGTGLTVKPTPSPSPRAHGAQGTDIELSQQRLAEWGFLKGSVDGHYGDDTEDAVKEFKTYQYDDYLAYLEANPTPSPEPTPTPTPAPTPTLAPGEQPVVVDATLPPDPTPTPTPAPYEPDGEITDSLLELFKNDSFEVYRETVRNGDEGREVERVQRRLHQLNYLYSADGAFGTLTENALKYFQRKNNLDQTGVADEETQRVLFSPDAIESEEYVFPYKLVVDLSDRRTYVYRWTGDGYNERIDTFKCCVGAPKTPTPQGTFQGAGQAGGRWYYFKDFNCYAQYAWRIQGGILFHSVTYSRPNENSGGSTRSLGRAESHGCVRLTVSDAKWIYDNCPMGTTVVVQE